MNASHRYPKHQEEEHHLQRFLNCVDPRSPPSYRRGPEPPDFELLDPSGTVVASFEHTRAIQSDDERRSSKTRHFETELGKALSLRGLGFHAHVAYADDFSAKASRLRQIAGSIASRLTSLPIDRRGEIVNAGTLRSWGVTEVTSVELLPRPFTLFSYTRNLAGFSRLDLRCLVRKKEQDLARYAHRYPANYLLIVSSASSNWLRFDDVPPRYRIRSTYTAVYLDVMHERIRKISRRTDLHRGKGTQTGKPAEALHPRHRTR